jgi:hypothetical protein
MGAETKEARELMRGYVTDMVDQLWSTDRSSAGTEPKSAQSHGNEFQAL